MHKLYNLCKLNWRSILWFSLVQRWSAPVGEREEPWPIKRSTSVRGRGEPTNCVRKSLNILPYYQFFTKEAHRFLAAYPPFVCHALPILHIYLEPYHNEERTQVYDIFWGNRRWAQATRMRSEQDGVCHNWGVGREKIAIHWDRAFKPGATNLSKHFEGKPPP